MLPCENCRSITCLFFFSFKIFIENVTSPMMYDYISTFSRNIFLLETSQPNNETFHKAACVGLKLVVDERQRLHQPLAKLG